MAARGGNIDGAAPFGSDETETIGGEGAAEELHAGLAERVVELELAAACVVVAVARCDPIGGVWRRLGEKLHDTPERGVAPRGRATAADELRALQRFAGHERPWHPAAER